MSVAIAIRLAFDAMPGSIAYSRCPCALPATAMTKPIRDRAISIAADAPSQNCSLLQLCMMVEDESQRESFEYIVPSARSLGYRCFLTASTLAQADRYTRFVGCHSRSYKR